LSVLVCLASAEPGKRIPPLSIDNADRGCGAGVELIKQWPPTGALDKRLVRTIIIGDLKGLY
jgi:hypothetical protein